MERDERGHWLPGRSANPGGRPGVPKEIRSTLRELSPRAVERLGVLLDSEDERIRLEAAKAIAILVDPQSRQTSIFATVTWTITLQRWSRRHAVAPWNDHARR